ncbi:DUF4097 family beta strand repeat-containing protein [Lysinibacillus xylanilyticus]|uniref:DUF4097 family beta strand repeat-containing protein n=1 Tax=Lysinibacillus xylanilyticus TaxID=582475 RepID=UPI003D085C79
MKKAIIVLILIIACAGVVLVLKVNSEQSFKKQQTFDAQQIEEIEINNETWNILLESTDSIELTIAIDGKQQKKQKAPVEIKQDGKKINVLQHDTEKGFFKNISIGDKGTIRISIPNNTVHTIGISNSNGDININNLTTKDIIISSDSGYKVIKGLVADKGEFTSQDGELKMMDSSVSKLTIAATNGDSYITRVNSPKAKITSTSGEVLMKEIIQGKALFVETVSGDITISYKEAPKSLDLIANSESSDISVNLEGYQKKEHTDQLKTGKIGDASNKLELISKEGIITVK